MRFPWLRLYVEIIDDRRLARLDPDHRWLFVVVLVLARKSPVPGRLMLTDSIPLSVDDIVDAAALPRKRVTAGLEALCRLGLIESDAVTWSIPGWERRQFDSDFSSLRVRKHREQRVDNQSVEPVQTRRQRSNIDVSRNVAWNGNETFRETFHARSAKRDRNAPDTDTDTDTDNPPNPPLPSSTDSLAEFLADSASDLLDPAANASAARSIRAELQLRSDR